MSIPSRESYEGAGGGWADGRLGQAYDLIDTVGADCDQDSPARMEIRALLGAIENADENVKLEREERRAQDAAEQRADDIREERMLAKWEQRS